MKESKVSTNIFFNILNQIVSLVVPLILSPYVARVLSPELIGDYSYALANSSYFVLIEALGLPLYGMLKVSANRNNKQYISTLFWEITIAKIGLMSLCIIAYIAMFCCIGHTSMTLSFIMIMNIISTGIDSVWFLSGLEDYKTITFRNIGVRILNVLLILLFVKTKNDFVLYALIMQGSNLLSYLLVFPTVYKYIVPVKVCYSNVFVHIKKSMIYFVPGIVSTIFSSADKTVLGAFANSYEVGVYEQASKLSMLCGSVINSISNVVLPRVTYLNNNASQEEAKIFLFKTLRFASVISIAVSGGMFCVADEFVPVFFGQGYEKSSLLLKILAVNVLMTVISNYLGQQCLIANNRQKEYNIAIGFSAILNLLFNIVVVIYLKSVGVSIASSVSSVITLMMILYFSKTSIKLFEFLKLSWKPILSAFVMIICSGVINIDGGIINLILKIVIGAFTYFVVLLLLKENFVNELFANISRRKKYDNK